LIVCCCRICRSVWGLLAGCCRGLGYWSTSVLARRATSLQILLFLFLLQLRSVPEALELLLCQGGPFVALLLSTDFFQPHFPQSLVVQLLLLDFFTFILEFLLLFFLNHLLFHLDPRLLHDFRQLFHLERRALNLGRAF
jgi:hypothetical protein